MRHPLAGQVPPRSMLIDVPRLVTAYFTERPDATVESERVSFGTSGHRGSALRRSFNERHILAIAHALCEYRKGQGIDGPLFLGRDTHALSEPAQVTALEVFAANGVTVAMTDAPTPTPAVSFAILEHNRGRDHHFADGVVITPSHNPPEDGGIKYNPPHGGPADTDATAVIESRANEILAADCREVRRISVAAARASDRTLTHDYVTPYVGALDQVLDLEVIRKAGLKIVVDPMGGSGLNYWNPIAERYGLNIDIANVDIDPTFSFMPLDHDGKIRMDCSSPWAMAKLSALATDFDIAFGNDTDYDRHGIVAPNSGLMNPNHYLAVAIDYLFSNRQNWHSDAMVGKTLVSSSMIDRVAAAVGTTVCEVPVGFKWFVDGLHSGRFAFAGEESAGASFVRLNNTAWTTDKDGIILGLLAAEITARCHKNPAEYYADLTLKHGEPVYERIDAPATATQKRVLKSLSPSQITRRELAGEPIDAILTHAPGNNAAIGGIKVTTRNGWFAARPSGTEDVYKIYAESFRGPEHLHQIQEQAQAMVSEALRLSEP